MTITIVILETDDVRDGKRDGFTLIKRDGKGTAVQMQFHYNGNHAPFPCTWYVDYKFDRYHNWIERHVYDFDPDNGKPTRSLSGIDYQVIEYYGDSKSARCEEPLASLTLVRDAIAGALRARVGSVAREPKRLDPGRYDGDPRQRDQREHRDSTS